MATLSEPFRREVARRRERRQRGGRDGPAGRRREREGVRAGEHALGGGLIDDHDQRARVADRGPHASRRLKRVEREVSAAMLIRSWTHAMNKVTIPVVERRGRNGHSTRSASGQGSGDLRERRGSIPSRTGRQVNAQAYAVAIAMQVSITKSLGSAEAVLTPGAAWAAASND